jgi:predicted dehydrogenase
MAIAAMECGKDVYCEQPMALRIDEARAFRDGAARWRRIVQIGAQETSAACWHLANDLLRSGAIGRPLWSQGSYTPSGPSRESNRAPRARPSLAAPDWAAFVGHAPRRSFDADRFFHWRKYWDYSAGVVTDSHYGKLAAILVAVGPAFPERVSAAGGIYLQDGREVPDCFVMTAEYAGGHTIVLASSMANAHGRPAVIRAEKATLELKDDAVTLVRESQPLVRNEALPAAPRSDHLDNWLTGIRTRRKCVCNENLGYCAMVAIAMAIQAYRTGRTMWFDPVREDLKPSPPPEPAPYGVTVA